MLRNLFTKLKLLYLLDVDAAEGVMRIGGTRVFLPPTQVLSATRDRLIDIGPAAQRFMYEAGKDAGREYAAAVEELGFSIASKEDFVKLCESFGILSGWGRIRVVKTDFENNVYRVEIGNTIFRSEQDEKVCEYHAGMLAGAAERILDEPMDAKEVACVNQDSEYCVFDMKKEGAFEHMF